MTLQRFALAAISEAFRSGSVDPSRPFYDPRIAAWLVWAARGSVMDAEERKALTRHRRVLQRAGIRRV